jgi:hypothetical protein
MAPFPTPKCEKCGREVDSMATSLNPLTGIWTLTVFCHGEKETMHYDRAEEGKIVEAVAFKGSQGAP